MGHMLISEMIKNACITLLFILLVFTLLFMLWAIHKLDKALIITEAPLLNDKYSKVHLLDFLLKKKG